MKTIMKCFLGFGLMFLSPFLYGQTKEAENFYQLANQQVEQRKYDEAAANLSKAIRLFPQYEKAYQLRGYCFFQQSEYEIARQDYEQVLNINSNSGLAKYYLGRILFYNKEFNTAIGYFKQVLNTDAEKDTYWWLAGIYQDYKLNYDSAIYYFNQMIRTDPGNLSGFYQRARCFIAKNDYEKAITDLNYVIKKEKRAWPLRTRSEVFRLQKKYAEAINDITEVIKLEPSAKDYISRGWIHIFAGDYSLAEPDFITAKKLEPKNFDAYRSLAITYWKRLRYEEAIEVFNQSLQNIDDNSAYLFKGRIRQQQGEYEKSLAEYRIYYEREKGVPSEEYVSLLVRLGKWEEARVSASNFLKAQATYNNQPGRSLEKCFLTIVSSYIPDNSYEKAVQLIEETIASNPNLLADKKNSWQIYTDLLGLKGWILEKIGKTNEAKDIYEQSLAIHPLQPNVTKSLVELNRQSKTIVQKDDMAPEIQLISPSISRGLEIVQGKNQIQVIGKAKDPAGIEYIIVNGKRLEKFEEDGLFATIHTFAPGLNDLVIIATDKQGNTATKTFTISTNAVGSNKNDELIVPVSSIDNLPQYHAIIIAAEQYLDPSIQDLESPVKDATELKNILETQYTFKPSNVETLYNQSREEIMQSIIQKSNALKENDNLLIFYAGHGIAEKDKFGDVDGYWIPSSAKKGNTATYISADDIKKSLKRSNSKHILVIADACFSGAFTRELSSDASVGVQKQYNVSSRKIMASGNMEPVPDNSRFIYYLKKNLRENKDKYLTAKKLFDSFYEAILNNSDTSPQYAAIKNIGDEGGEFVFIKK